MELFFDIAKLLLHLDGLVRFFSTPVGQVVVLVAAVVALGLMVRDYVQLRRDERRHSRRPPGRHSPPSP